MYSSLFEAFSANVASVPDKPFLCVPAGLPHAPDGIEMSYAQVAAEVETLIGAYRRAGYKSGHRVALMLESRPLHFMHFLALNALGVSQVPVNPDLQLQELMEMLEHSESDLLVCLTGHCAKASAALEGKGPLVVDAQEMPLRIPPIHTSREPVDANGSPEAALLYTSGTTGKPKACVLSNYHFLRFGQWYLESASAEGSLMHFEHGKERLMCPLPVYHMAGGGMPFAAMILGQGCFIMSGRFSARRWWRDVVSTRATIVHYLGIVPVALLNQPVSAEEKQHTVKWGRGAGIEPGQHKAFEERFGFPHLDSWGMTEIAATLSVDREPRMIGQRAIGKQVRDLEVRIVDDTQADVPVGTPGELLVRTLGDDPRKAFFASYLKDPQATGNAWRGGWFHTGDIVRMDSEGMMYFVDRAKNIIRRSGENIAAIEVETALLSDPGVQYAAVISAPDEVRGEEVYACIVLKDGTARDTAAHAHAIFDTCTARLAYHKAPGWMIFMPSLPMGDTHKVKRTKIFADGVDPRTVPGAIDLRARKTQTRTAR